MQTIRSIVAKKIGLPIKALVKGERTTEILRELNEAQWWEPDRLQELRTRRLRKLLVAVAQNVPFYRREIGRIGAAPDSDDPWEILSKLPTIDKATYRQLGSDLQSDHPARPPIVAHTSGTTGERLQVRIDTLASSYRYLAGFRGRQWWGVEPGDTEYKIWGSGIRTAKGTKEYLRKVLGLVKDWSVGVTVVSPFFQTDRDLKRAADLLFRIKPSFVFGYSNSIHLLAAYLVREGRQAGPGWPRAVAYTAEMLLDWQRADITAAFNAPVVAEYGSCEAGVMAYQCPEGRMHRSDDFMVLETVDEKAGSEGGVGEIVVTNLLATDYPLIRYRQGDLARLDREPCSCGRGLGTISSLVGRMNDCFVSPSGGIVDFIVVDQAMKDQPAIRRFKVVERAAGDLVFLAELHEGRDWSEADRQRFVSQCVKLLPPDVKLETRTTDHLPSEPSGKFRIMIPAAEAARYL